MNTNSRAAILHAIASALRKDSGTPQAPLPDVTASPATEPASAALGQRFTLELRALGGQAHTVVDEDECAAAIASHMRLHELHSIAVQATPLSIAIACLLTDAQVARAQDLTMEQLAAHDCSLLQGVALIADSGSVLVIADHRMDRSLPYLPGTCFIVARAQTLHSELSAETIAPAYQMATSNRRGEAVIITGPSRTADIEKILILGAHGPRAIIVFILEG